MRRRLVVVVVVVAAVSLTFVLWHRPKTITGQEQASSTNDRPGASNTATVRPPVPVIPLPAVDAPPSAEPRNEWLQSASLRRNIGDTLKPEREAEIDAVAPRMHLTEHQVTTLKRWHDRRQDLQVNIWSGSIDTESAFQQGLKKEAMANAALAKAEKRLLGGLDRYNQLNKLMFASQQGRLDRVDDSGDLPVPAGAKGHEIVTHHPAPPAIDTAEYDQYFED